MENTQPKTRKRRTNKLTLKLTLKLPPEFIELCDHDGVTPGTGVDRLHC